MPIEFVEQDDLDELEERLQRRIDEIDTGGYPVPVGAWEDATGDVLWGFKGLRRAIRGRSRHQQECPAECPRGTCVL